MRACGFAFAVRSIRSCQNACTELLIVGVDAGVGVDDGHGGCLSSPVSLISVSEVYDFYLFVFNRQCCTFSIQGRIQDF